MNLHVHTCFHFHGILEGTGRYSDRFSPYHRGIALRVDLFIDTVLIQISTKIQLFAVELREGRRNFQRKADDLIGYELSF